MRDIRIEENPGYGFVEFGTSEAVKAARQLMDGRLIKGMPLKVYRAQMMRKSA